MDLKAYQHARRVAVLSRPLIARLPDTERDLADQRSWSPYATSVPGPSTDCFASSPSPQAPLQAR